MSKLASPYILPLIAAGFFACASPPERGLDPIVPAGEAWSVPASVDGERLEKWWLAFGDGKLDGLMATAFTKNLSLKQAFARLDQAAAFHKGTRTANKPALTGELSGSETWDKDGNRTRSRLFELGLSWEADLWGRLSSAEKAAALESGAREDELSGAALLLAGSVADTYFQIAEQRLKLDLLKEQIAASETYLELVEFRFSQGDASLVDIYQQRQQLSALRSELPPVRSKLATLGNRLSVLLGSAPMGDVPESVREAASAIPTLPPFPALGIPADLLVRRPDLNARKKALAAADYRVAEAIADRLPRLRIGAAIGIRGKDLSGDYRFRSLFAEAIAPIVDWGRRKAEVARRRALAEEELAKYSEAYLKALEEVENALAAEREGTLLIAALEEQLQISASNLAESRNRYMQGLNDYLPVLTALQAKQRLEREIITERRALVSNRVLLYRALGGADFMNGLKETANEKGTL